MRKTAVCFFVSLMMLIPCVALAQGDAEEIPEQQAQNITSSLKYETKGHYSIRENIIGKNVSKFEDFSPYEEFFVYFDPQSNAHWLCIQWNTMPEGVEIIQMDETNAILQTTVPNEYDTILELNKDTVRIGFYTDRHGMSIARLALYTEGTLPEPFYHWRRAERHLDYLIISTHPDDDVLFMGGIIPIYGKEKGYTGTVAYVTSPSRRRVNEAVLGALAMGAEIYPFFLDFMDLNQKHSKMFTYIFMPDIVTRALVRLLRQQRPLVVFSQDVNGEYGHWQHKIVSAAVVDACKLAADNTYDPASAAEYGVWEVKKCYLHLYPQNALVMDVNIPLASMGGKTAIEVAQAAFSKHASQQSGRHNVQKDTDRDSLSRFGMAYGTVDAGEDVFDNIDPALLVSALLQESAPAA